MEDVEDLAQVAMRLFDPEPAAKLLKRHRAVVYPFMCQFGEATLEVAQGVFCPVLTNTSQFLLQNIEIVPSSRVLDAFTGTGAFAIIAALRGADSVAVDMSIAAVHCASKNARLNDVARRVDVLHGSACSVPQGKFDCIIANPPLLPGIPASNLEAAIYDPDLKSTKEFIYSLPARLSNCGVCYILTSDVLERHGSRVEDLSSGVGLVACRIACLDVGYESYRVHRIAHS